MRLLFIILLFSQVARGEDFYVSTTGGGSGSFASPWSLATALAHPAAVDPGDNIYLLAGTYTGTFTSTLNGTSLNPIIVKAAAGNRVIIDGTREGQGVKYLSVITVNGSYTWFWGLEVTNSDPDRTDGIAVDSGTRGLGFDVLGPGCKIINCIIYDTGESLGAWTSATNSEYNGNVMFNNGWWADDQLEGTGHGIYTQNNTGTKTFKDNVICNNFGNGWQLYGSDVAFLNNFYIEGNVCFNDRWLMGGAAPINDIELVSNFAYNNTPEFGFQSHANDGMILTNNFFASSMYLYWWSNVTATGNTFFNGHIASSAFEIHFDGPASTPPNLSAGGFNYAFSNNTYYFPTGSTTGNRPIAFYNNRLNVGDDVFWQAGWQALPQDASINIELYTNSGGLQITGEKIFVRQNDYDPARATVIIYNWDSDATIAADVSAILTAGDTYELRNVLDYFGDVITGTYSGGNLSIPMTGHTVALPLGYGTEQGASTFPEFGTFILIKTGADTLPHVTPVRDRGQASAVRISQDRGSGLPHVRLGTGQGSGDDDIARDNLLVDEGFEGGDPWTADEFVLGQDNLGEDHGGGTNTWARVQVNSGANEGTSAHQIEVRTGCDGCQSQGYRSEMTFQDDLSANNTTYWYGFSMKFVAPASGGFFTGENSGVFLQWHPTSGSAPASIALSNDYNENGQGWTLWTDPSATGSITHHESGTDITSGVWHHVVMKIHWGTTSNGTVQVWIDGVEEFDVTGLDFNVAGAYMKFGMNRWSWSGPDCDASGCTTSSYPNGTWTIQYDNLRVGSSSATYNDVAPVQVLPEP